MTTRFVPFYHPPKGMRCVWLDPDAKRCRRPAFVGVQFHANPEWHSMWWIVAYLCKQHADEYDA